MITLGVSDHPLRTASTTASVYSTVPLWRTTSYDFGLSLRWWKWASGAGAGKDVWKVVVEVMLHRWQQMMILALAKEGMDKGASSFSLFSQ